MNYEIEITRRCNYKCPGCNHLCNIAPDPSSDMTDDDVASVVSQINALDPSPGLIIVIGGEPTLHPRCVEYCRYIKEHLRRGGELLLDTNFSNPDVCAECEKVGFTLRDYKGSRDPDEVFRRKASYHFNVLISPKHEHLNAIDPRQCNVLNGLGGAWSCGLSVHRYKGALRWCWCPGGSSICKLLRREEFMFGTLAELYSSDVDLFRRTICPHCQYLARPQILARDSMGRVSECFREGLEELKRYNAAAESAASTSVSCAEPVVAVPGSPARPSVPDCATVLGFAGKPQDAYGAVEELKRVGVKPEIYWNIKSAFQRFVPHGFMTGGFLANPSSLSCYLGHYHIVKSAFDRGIQSLWVVEDDIRFMKDASVVRSALSTVPADADLLVLDGFPTVETTSVFNRNGPWARMEPSVDIRSACDYILLNRKAMEQYVKLLDGSLCGKMPYANDYWKLLKDLNVYTAYPLLSIQRVDGKDRRSSTPAHDLIDRYTAIGLDLSNY